jgi:uncharacterized protein YndB with AHSA1/START domain
MSKENGIITTAKNRATITFQRRLPHPAEKVWAAITEPEQRIKWFGQTSIEAKKGGRIETMPEGPPAPPEVRRSSGIITEWDPPRLFEYEEEAATIGKSIVRFELESDGDETLLRVINKGLNISDARGYAPGWHAFLDRFEAHLNGKSLPEWSKRYAGVQSIYAG